MNATTGLYRKKPIVVHATQWWSNGDHPEDGVGEEILDPVTGETYLRQEGQVVRYYRVPDTLGEQVCGQCERRMHDHGWIDTLEGGLTVCPSDWVITGAFGEFYPCKASIFEATYEPVPPAEEASEVAW